MLNEGCLHKQVMPRKKLNCFAHNIPSPYKQRKQCLWDYQRSMQYKNDSIYIFGWSKCCRENNSWLDFSVKLAEKGTLSQVLLNPPGLGTSSLGLTGPHWTVLSCSQQARVPVTCSQTIWSLEHTGQDAHLEVEILGHRPWKITWYCVNTE